MIFVDRATRALIRSDLHRYGGDASFRNFVRQFVRTPGFRFSYYLRKLTYFQHKSGPIAFFARLYNRFWYGVYRVRFGFDISPRMPLGSGLYLGHWGGVVINFKAVIGSNVNIAHGVTIGAESRGPRTGAPTIGDRVWIGTHAIVVGNVTIEDDALIAPGAFVNFDVPASSIVVGNPAKIVSNRGSEGYVNFTIGCEHPDLP